MSVPCAQDWFCSLIRSQAIRWLQGPWSKENSAWPAFSGEWPPLVYGSFWMFFLGCDRAPSECVRAFPMQNSHWSRLQPSVLGKKDMWRWTLTSHVTVNSGTCITDRGRIFILFYCETFISLHKCKRICGRDSSFYSSKSCPFWLYFQGRTVTDCAH